MPANLNYFAILDKDRHGSLSMSQDPEPLTRRPIFPDVVLGEFRVFPFEPLPHLPGVRTTRCSKEFKLGHGGAPRAIYGGCDARKPSFPEFYVLSNSICRVHRAQRQ